MRPKPKTQSKQIKWTSTDARHLARCQPRKRKPVGTPGVADQRLVSRRKTSPDVVRDIMFLFGVDSVSAPKFRVATAMVRGIWLDGYSIGWEMKKRKPALLKKLTDILCGKEKAANSDSATSSRISNNH